MVQPASGRSREIPRRPARELVRHLPTKFVESTPCQKVAPGSAKFLFIPDITNKATGITLVVLIAVYVGSQLGSTLIATATADPNQRRLMLLLPVVFVVILYKYPAGLLVYWITTNLWTIGQQYLIKRHMGPVAKPGSLPPPGSENGKADGKKPLPPPKPEPVAAAAATGSSGGSTASATRARCRLRGLRVRRRNAQGGDGDTKTEATASSSLSRRSRTCSRRSSRISSLDAGVEVEEQRRRPDRALGRRERRPVHRPARPDDRRGAAPGAADRLPRRPVSHSRRDRRRMATASAAPTRCAARPTTRLIRRSARGGPSSSIRCRRPSVAWSTNTCASATTSRPTARATNPNAISWSRPSRAAANSWRTRRVSRETVERAAFHVKPSRST